MILLVHLYVLLLDAPVLPVSLEMAVFSLEGCGYLFVSLGAFTIDILAKNVESDLGKSWANPEFHLANLLGKVLESLDVPFTLEPQINLHLPLVSGF
jgi:hypothetical protein